jgi:hypothetical protein
MVFKPSYLHGTTLYRKGTKRAGIIFTFSSHIKSAYEKAMASSTGLVAEDREFSKEIESHP